MLSIYQKGDLLLSIYLFILNFYCGIFDLQCCVNFRCPAKWINCTYTYIHSFFRCFSHIGHYKVLSRVPCAIIGAYNRFLLVVYFTYSSLYTSIPISQFIPPPYRLVTIGFLHLWLYFCFVTKFICTLFLVSTCKRHHMIFVFLCLTYLTQYANL